MTKLTLYQSLADIDNPYQVMLVGESHNDLTQGAHVLKALPGLKKNGYGSYFNEATPRAEQLYKDNFQSIRENGNPAKIAAVPGSTALNNALYMQTVLLGMDFIFADSPNRLNKEAFLMAKEKMAQISEATEQRIENQSDALKKRNADAFPDGFDQEAFLQGVVYASFGGKAFDRLHDRLALTADQKEVAKAIGAMRRDIAQQYTGAQMKLFQYKERNDHIAQQIAENGHGKKIAVMGERHVAMQANTDGLLSLSDILQERYDVESMTVLFTNAAHINEAQDFMKQLNIKPDEVTLDEFEPIAQTSGGLSGNMAAHAFALSGQEIFEGIHDTRDHEGLIADYVVVLPDTSNETAAQQARQTLTSFIKPKI